jgi:hypothetical protein
MFNETSAMPEREQGHLETQVQPQAKESDWDGVERRPGVLHEANSETIPAPSVSAGTPLPWYLDMKYQWARNASGNGFRLVPQENFIQDVLIEGDAQVAIAAEHFMDKKSEDLPRCKTFIKESQTVMQTLTGLQLGEAKAYLREIVLKRLILARKIVGTSEMSMQHRIEHARMMGWDEEQTKQYDNYKSAKEARDKWAPVACFYEYAATQLADGDVIPKEADALAELVGRRIRTFLKDEAYEEGTKLQKPAPVVPAGDRPAMTREERRLATA